MAGNRRPELVELRLDRFVSARHHTDALQFAQFGVRAGDGRVAFAHVGLTFEAEHRERGAFGRGVEHGEFHRARVAALIARVVALHLCLGPLGLGRHRLTQRVIRRAEIPRHLHVRHVEGVADLVETIRFAVLWQRVSHLQPRRVQQVAQRVFVFVAIEPALRRPTFLRRARLLRLGEGRRQ